ncbi:MAG: FAD-dependent oxidoreductase [Nitrospinae bacterium]|nr:FAD-dependent oxidoreductase [Nitrospinota bacterium]
MAIVVKKKTRGFAAKSGASSAGSSLRPKYQPKTPPCQVACPSSEPIRFYLRNIAEGNAVEESWRQLVDKNPIPAVMGRVCPHPCEGGCNRQYKQEDDGGPVAINNVERFIGDYGIQNGLKLSKLTDETHAEKIAVIGAGPAGISCAYQLARRGYKVTIFEQFPEAGGMLRYGIPSYRLPREVLKAEIGRILDLGVELKTNCKIGRDISFDQIKSGYQAIYLGIGAHTGITLDIPGEDAPNVFTGAAYLNKINQGEKVEIGDTVVVIGGGDSAIDAARTSWRLGANVTIAYRRSRKEMPAISHEVDEALSEGLKLEELAAPVEIVKGADGRATGVKMIRMELGEPDASGRRRPKPVEGSEFVMPATTVIAAVSQKPDYAGLEKFSNGDGWIGVNQHFETSEGNVFAGGDVTLKLGLVTEAVGLGRKAAVNIDNKLRGREMVVEQNGGIAVKEKMLLGWYKNAPRNNYSTIPLEERRSFKEANLSLTLEQVQAETARCMSCGACFDCENCWMYCQDNAVIKNGPKDYAFKLENCIGCSKCAENCPCGYIDMQ